MTLTSCKRFLLLYGSQTGQAKAIAEEIRDNAENHGLQADLFCFSLTEKKFWLERETHVVIVVSTTGEGEAPDTAQKFWRRLKKKTLPNDHLAKLNYALLGLGDSNYTNFCNCSKNLDKRLQELGAKQFYPSGFADDAVGLEIVVEPWMDGLWATLKQQLSPETDGVDNSQTSTSNSTISSDQSTNSDSTSGEKSGKEVEASFQESKHHKADFVNGLCEVAPSGDERTSGSNEIIVTSQNTDQLKTENRIGESDETDKMDISPDEIDNTGTSTPSIKVSLPPLSENALNLPVCPLRFLTLKFQKEMTVKVTHVQLSNNSSYPSAASNVAMATLISLKQISRKDAVKKTLQAELDIENASLTYSAGDSFGVICPNSESEVMQLLQRLGLREEADSPFTLSVIEDTKKKAASVPAHIPEPCSLKSALVYYCDIRSPPKKAFLRSLVEYTSDPSEKRRLQELCSRQGAPDYSQFVREAGLSLLDILTHFPTCQPPVSLLLEHLPRLLPRPYSASSCLEACPDRLHFVFNVVDIPAGNGRTYDRKGVCTGWLESLSKPLSDNLEDCMDNLKLNLPKIPVYARTNQLFHLPADSSVPVIMIGPGTGVAPFIGFLQQREFEKKQKTKTDKLGEMWLLFGCRHKDRDYLYRSELESFVESGVLTNLLVSFSRDDNQDVEAPRYVQHNMKLHASALCELLCEQGAHIYVCGDARGMAPSVNETWVQMIQEYKGWSKEESQSLLAEKRKKKEYLEDVWT